MKTTFNMNPDIKMKSLLSVPLLALAFSMCVTMISLAAEAHTRLKPSAAIVPRSTDPGVKAGPCGSYARSVNPAVLRAGDMITVTWEETINHPGRFEIYWSSAGDQNFTLMKTVTDTQDTAISGTAYHQNSATFQLPSTPCTECTLQLIQVMTDNNPPTNYYSCADIQLVAAVAPTPTPNPSVNPTPTPTATTPAVDCAPVK